MRIALDIRFHTSSGASNYMIHLIEPLRAANRRYEFVLMRFEDQALSGGLDLPTIDCPRMSVSRQVVWDQLRLPGVLDRAGIDLFHPLKFLGSLRPKCPQVLMGHSITSRFRGDFPTAKKALFYWSFLGDRLYRRATHVIAVSGYVRDFLTEGLGIPPERVTVVYNGKDERYRRVPDLQPPPSLTSKVHRPFVLTVGNLFPVKNQLTAVRAFAQIADRLPEHTLVLAGGTQHAYAQTVRDAVQSAGLQQRVAFLGFVDPETLLYLYNTADAMMMPSLTEGCPITLIEAMACGVAAVGSRRGGITELGEGVMRLIDDPYDDRAFAHAVHDIVTDENLRSDLSAKAEKRASQFTWASTAADTLAVYDKVLQSE